ncbi:MAG: ATP synthase F1 subunit delta [Planctomycetota bacterium]|nr:ATP synthase F1 subunit delta [Planctomycetota bacterium]
MPSEASESLAFVYAEALYDAAVESGSLVRVEEELLALKGLLAADPRYLRFFETPTVGFDDKRKVVGSVFGGLSKELANFLLVTIRKGRVGMLPAIVDAFHEHANRKAGIAEFTVISARALEDGERNVLRQRLEQGLKRKIEIREKVEPELLGGFVLAHEDQRWDCSLIHRLGRLVDRVESVKPNLGIWSQGN